EGRCRACPRGVGGGGVGGGGVEDRPRNRRASDVILAPLTPTLSPRVRGERESFSGDSGVLGLNALFILVEPPSEKAGRHHIVSLPRALPVKPPEFRWDRGSCRSRDGRRHSVHQSARHKMLLLSCALLPVRRRPVGGRRA